MSQFNQPEIINCRTSSPTSKIRFTISPASGMGDNNTEIISSRRANSTLKELTLLFKLCNHSPMSIALFIKPPPNGMACTNAERACCK